VTLSISAVADAFSEHPQTNVLCERGEVEVKAEMPILASV